jgi:hypothetical protein
MVHLQSIHTVLQLLLLRAQLNKLPLHPLAQSLQLLLELSSQRLLTLSLSPHHLDEN